MENLPESEWMKELESRLRNYNEQPNDNTWFIINQAVKQPTKTIVLKWLDYASACAAILLMVSLFILPIEKKSSSILKTELTNANRKAETVSSFEKRSLASNASVDNRDTTIYSTDSMELNTKRKLSTNKYTVDSDETPTHEQEQKIVRLDSSGTLSLANNVNVDEPTLNHSDFLEDNVTRLDTVSLKVESDDVNKPSKRSKNKATSFYAQLTPMLTYYDVKPLANDAIVIEGFNSPSILSAKRFGLGAEIGLQGKIARKLTYTAGLLMYHQKQELSYSKASNAVKVERSVTEPLSFTATPQEEIQVATYNMFNVGASTSFFYELKSKDLIHKIGFSLSYQQGLIRQLENTSYANDKSSYGFYSVLYRVEYPINTKLKFYLQPSYSHGFFVREELSEPFLLQPSRVGVGMGLVFGY